MAQDFLYVQVLNERKLLRNLGELPDVARQLLIEYVTTWTSQLYDATVENIRSRLSKTGRLEQAVKIEIINDGIRVDGRVYIAGVPYAQALERGATVPPHIITAKNSKVLAFMAATGDKVFATRVFHPGGVIPAAHYMRDAYRFMSPKVSQRLRRQYLRDLIRKTGLG